MDDVKVNAPVNVGSPQVPQAPKQGFAKKLFKLLGIIVLLIVVIGALWFTNKNYLTKNQGAAAIESESIYTAVFLANGQVYFGKLAAKDSSEITLNDVYYLQLSDPNKAQTELSEQKFSLVKLGNELHGPTDELFINMSQVLFYEKLRDDSKVVQSIKDAKK